MDEWNSYSCSWVDTAGAFGMKKPWKPSPKELLEALDRLSVLQQKRIDEWMAKYITQK